MLITFWGITKSVYSTRRLILAEREIEINKMPQSDMFNFILRNVALNSNGKRGPSGSTIYSYIKRPSQGSKVIRIEMYDADKIPEDGNNCKCQAELCVQHVVTNYFMDNIYRWIYE
ncbi:hypothetical protein evm_002765 [Chilo suppressalis]|nr:hypothetical protein evm_002765 [Chilo suppressalis]